MKSFVSTTICSTATIIAAASLGTVSKHASLPRPPSTTAPTYARDVAPIINSKCVSCHRPGQVAPFSLEGYRDVASRAKTVASAVKTGYMPPWHAAPNFGGPFADSRTLTSEQKSVLVRWANAGAPAGDLSHAPPAPHYNSGWQMGTPDLVLQPAASYNLSASGHDVYRCFVIPTHLTENRYLRAVEMQPGNLHVVHHIIGYIDTSGQAMKMAAGTPDLAYDHFGGPGFNAVGSIGGWVPGMGPQILPEGVGMLLPANSDLVLQVHYHKNGKPETDRTRFALYFSNKPVDKQLRNLVLLDRFLDIPAGDAGYEARAEVTLPAGIHLTEILPHMHLIGHDMRVTAALPDGKVLPLILVPNWDFNWQTRYALVQPLALPAGTTIRLVAHFDNSSGNPRNPNSPPRHVAWGEQTTDEMCLAFLSYTADSEHITQGQQFGDRAEMARATLNGIVVTLFAKFDQNHDGKLDQAELANLIRFMQNSNLGRRAGGQAPPDPTQLAGMAIKMFNTEGDGRLSIADVKVLIARFGQRGAFEKLN